MHGQLFRVAVVGQAVDGGINAELTHPVFADAAVQDFQGRQLVHGHHGALMLHQASEHGSEDFTRHALKAFVRFLAQAFVLVVEQAEINLGDAAGRHVPVDLRKQSNLQSPVRGNAEIHGQVGGEGKLPGQGVVERPQITQVGQGPENFLQAHQQRTNEQAGGPSLQGLGFQ